MPKHTVTCPLCESEIAAGSWDGGARPDKHPNRYLQSHLARCRGSSEAERAYFHENNKWPPKGWRPGKGS